MQRHAAVPMEPRGFLADWDARRQPAHRLRRRARWPSPTEASLPRRWGCRSTSIRMVENDVGGGFGARGEFYPEDFLIPFAARLPRPPGEMDRGPARASDRHQSRARCRMRTGDRLRARRHDPRLARRVPSPTSAPICAPMAPRPRATWRSCCRVPTASRTSTWTSRMLVTNKTPSGTYRGPGRFEADFFRERLIDMAAADLGLDRVAIRRRNLVREADMPYSLPHVVELDLDTECDSGDYSHHLRPLPRGIRLGGQVCTAGQADRRPLSRHRDRLLHRGRRLRPARECRACCSMAMAWSPSSSARPRSGRASRPSSRRSPPMRWNCRWTAFAACFTARPTI